MQRRPLVLSRRSLIAAPAALMASPADANTTVVHWPGGARAAVSLTYDDGLNSQLEHAVPDLEARGLRATFYLTKDNVAPRIDDWVSVARHGHEIGNHSVTHLCEVAGSTPKSYYDSEVAPMESWLGDHFGPSTRSYAFPCGFVDLGSGPGKRDRRKAYLNMVGRTFYAARGVDGGPNHPSDIANLRRDLHAFEPTYEHDDPFAARAYVSRAIAQGGWAILVFHEIVKTRKYEGDTSIKVHRAILDDLVKRPVWCAPVGEVYARLINSQRAALARGSSVGRP